MQNSSLYLPGFHLATLRRKPRSCAQKLADEKSRIRQHSISQLGDCFAHFIPAKALENGSEGAFSRRRLFSKENTFWAFFSQILDADGGWHSDSFDPAFVDVAAISLALHDLKI